MAKFKATKEFFKIFASGDHNGYIEEGYLVFNDIRVNILSANYCTVTLCAKDGIALAVAENMEWKVGDVISINIHEGKMKTVLADILEEV